MTQKLLIIKRDTKRELQKAIEKNVLNKNMRLTNFSVLEQKTKYILAKDKNGEGHYEAIGYFEAWCIVEVPENKERVYRSLDIDDKMGMTE